MEPTQRRRDVLKGMAAGGAFVVGGSGLAGANDSSTVDVVEVGTRFELPSGPDYHVVQLNSRPPYTVKPELGRLSLMGATEGFQSELVESGRLVDEQPTDEEQSETITSGETVHSVPIRLSARKRPESSVFLGSPHELSRVAVESTAVEATISVESYGTVEVEPDSSRSIVLDPVGLDVETVSEEYRDSPDVPENERGPVRSYDSRTVEATPVVEIDYHSDLIVEGHR